MFHSSALIMFDNDPRKKTHTERKNRPESKKKESLTKIPSSKNNCVLVFNL